MHLFEVIALEIEDIPTVPVFAESYDLAVHLYMIWWLHLQQGDLPDLEVKKRNPEWPGLDAELLAKALKLNISGVGRFEPGVGWSIHAPGDEAAGDQP